MAAMQKIANSLWFDNQAEEAARFYVSVFKNAELGRITRYSEVGFDIHKRPAGSVLTVEFFIEGSAFLALNGGPVFTFSEAISFVINCDTQHEIDYYWDRLSEGGDPKAQECGWLKDKFGLSWQVTPRVLDDMLADHESEGAKRAMAAMLKMKKLDIAGLQKAYDGK